MNGTPMRDLAVQFVVELDRVVNKIEGRSIFKNQLIRSGSSIGANIHEARYAQSNEDFISKFEIALKECYETEYWLEILMKVNAIPASEYHSLRNQCGVLRKKLIASILTVKSKDT